MTAMKVKALVPWYGSNRSLAHEVGKELAGCRWVGVPFAGGLCELVHIEARSIVVGDLHRHLINLAQVAGHPKMGPQFYRRVRRLPLHPDVLAWAQDVCAGVDGQDGSGLFGGESAGDQYGVLDRAVAYYVCAWMTRNGTAGTDGELRGGLCTRWDAGGGDPATRWQNAIRSLPAWRRIMRRCLFEVRDAFNFLSCINDCGAAPKGPVGIYCDPPFPGPGDKYRHSFTEAHQVRLAKTFGRFRKARVVCRFYDHPLIRELYPEDRWTWRRLDGGKTQTNKAAPEVLLINKTNSRDAA